MTKRLQMFCIVLYSCLIVLKKKTGDFTSLMDMVYTDDLVCAVDMAYIVDMVYTVDLWAWGLRGLRVLMGLRGLRKTT